MTIPVIPPEQYGSLPKADQKAQFLNYAKYAACGDVMAGIIDGLKITPFGLGKLLGMANPGNAYPWFGGAKRPSQMYCIRIMKLMALVHFENLNIVTVDSIDWETGDIILKEGLNDKSGNGISSGKRKVSEGQGRHRDPMAEFLNQSF